MKPFIVLCLLSILLSCKKDLSHPNVVFILSDDQGWGDMSSHGNPVLQTPTLDRLATEGFEFNRFFASPLCAPTRASLLTGRYHMRTGVTSVSNGLEIMDEDETTLAEMFKASGYSTGIFGKWHNGAHYPHRPEDQGFDEFIGFCAGHLTNYFNTTLEHSTNRPDEHPTEIKSVGYITDFLADQAIDFIKRHKQQPFFCYVPFNAPHSPFQVPDAYFDKYKSRGLDDTLASIYCMVDNLDFNIGRLLQSLKDQRLDKNTIVIFMSDNGPNGVRYNGYMKGIKGQVDEGGVRVPSMVLWPGQIKAGTSTDQIAAHIDWYPTLQTLCHLNTLAGKPIDGKDLSGIILNKTDTLSDRKIFSHVAFLEKELKPKPGSVRTPRYRMVWKSAAAELYDMSSDPQQLVNLAATDSITLSTLSNLYQSWFSSATQDYQPIKPVNVNTSYIELPAYESTFTGSLHYAEGHGWAHDWLQHWATTEDEISWSIISDTPTTFTAYLKYTCPAGDTGSIITTYINEAPVASAKIIVPFDPPLTPSPDRVIRKEAYEKEWRMMELGNIVVPSGQSKLSLRASEVRHGMVGEVMGVVMER
ncbi:MAG: arylsulfatase [Saprospiraceae bacterium]